MRCIAHVDMDCFYAQVEANRLGIDCRTTPFILEQWGSLIAVNYPARAHGIQRFHTLQEARQRCPDVVVGGVATYRLGEHGYHYHADANRQTHKVALEPYRDASRRIFALLSALPHVRVEKASVDEAFIDVTEAAQRELDELRRARSDVSSSSSNNSDGDDSTLDALRDVLSPGTRLVEDRTAEMHAWCVQHGTTLSAVYDVPMHNLQRRLRAHARRSCVRRMWVHTSSSEGSSAAATATAATTTSSPSSAVKRGRSPSVTNADDDDNGEEEEAKSTARHSDDATYEAMGDGVVGSDAFSVAAHLRDADAHATHAANCLLLCAATRVVQRIRQRLADELHYDCSAGIAHNRLLAKCISARHKPNQQTLLLPDGAASALFDVPLVKLNGFGGKLGRAVHDVCSAYLASHGVRQPRRRGRRRDGATHGSSNNNKNDDDDGGRYVRRQDGHNSTSSDDIDGGARDEGGGAEEEKKEEQQLCCRDVWLVPLSRLCAIHMHDDDDDSDDEHASSSSSSSSLQSKRSNNSNDHSGSEDESDGTANDHHQRHRAHDAIAAHSSHGNSGGDDTSSSHVWGTAQYVYYRVRGYASDVVSARSMARILMASKVFAPGTRELDVLRGWVAVLAEELCARYASFAHMYGVEGRSLNVKLGCNGLRRMGGVCNRTVALPYLVTAASLTSAVMRLLRAVFAATRTTTTTGKGSNSSNNTNSNKSKSSNSTPFVNCIALTITRFVAVSSVVSAADDTSTSAVATATTSSRTNRQQTLLTAFATAAAATAQRRRRGGGSPRDTSAAAVHTTASAPLSLSPTRVDDEDTTQATMTQSSDVDSVVVLDDGDEGDDSKATRSTRAAAEAATVTTVTAPCALSRDHSVLTALRRAAAAAAAKTQTRPTPQYVVLHDDDDDSVEGGCDDKHDTRQT